MRLLNRIIIVAVSVLLTLVLASCVGEKTYRIGVSQCSRDDWRDRMNQEILREAMFHDNAEVEIRSADDSSEKQIADIRYFADNGFDIIIAAPNEAAPVTPVIDEVMARGIPVVVFDRSVVGDNYTAFQGADNDSIGWQVAEYTRSVASPDAKIIEICGNMASTPAQGRSSGFAAGIALSPGMSVVGSASGNWNYDPALRVADSLLAEHPDADVIYAHNDRMAVAASDAAARRGLHPFIIGIDAAPEIGMKAVKEGKIDATFIYPTDGHSLLLTALAILEGKPYSRVTRLPSASAVDRSNADILLLQNESLNEQTSRIKALKSQVDTYWDRHSIQTTFLYVTLAILILLCGALFLLLRMFWINRRQQRMLVEQNHELERQRDNERQLNKQLNEATQSKLMFYTNVSHDLRTPLTLIAESLRQLVGAGGLSPRQAGLAGIADKNVRILRRLINQVLDFRKYENGKMDLSLSEVDLRQLVREWSDAFSAVARQRHMKLDVECAWSGPGHVAVDVGKIERVFFNLVSNAFKYTPDNGEIRVRLSFTDDEVSLSVEDTGRGISPEDLGNIFGRFFRVDKVHPDGSGIGLSLAKAFVELHGGSISAQSEPGKGSLFTVLLPVRHVAETVADVTGRISAVDVTSELTPAENTVLPVPPEVSDDASSDLPLLLVIDDNDDMLVLVSDILRDRFRVITARDGAAGVRMAARYVPDIVVCDVMMPVMDGLECCRRIKEEVSTSHIPVLMLTACSMDEQRVQGYESGADGYLSKPFDSAVLRARCVSLVENRRRIREVWSASVAVSSPSPDAAAQSRRPAKPMVEGAPSAVDSDFYNRFIEIFGRRMGDADVSVDAIAAEMGLGRSQFYRKIKALTNFSPVELMRTIRLKEARHRLLTTDMSVSEIAYAVGFSTPAYFTKCYREEFGETPSDTRSNLVN